MTTRTYLGDAVYASFDGYCVILTTGHHDEAIADNIVVLEPEVLTHMTAWMEGGYEDYNSGLKFGE